MTHSMTRKTFGTVLMGGSVMLLLESCGGGGSSDAAAPVGGATAQTGCSNTIAGNHGHLFSVAIADLSSTSSKTYDIRGSADHTHTVTLSAADLAKLKTGASVTVATSETASHTHSVSLACM